jgi:hypothetical protein
MKKHNHPFVHSNWVLLASIKRGAEANPGAEPFVLARHLKSCSGASHWEVMHGGHYMGATHWAEVAAFDDVICDFAA